MLCIRYLGKECYLGGAYKAKFVLKPKFKVKEG